MAARAGRFDPNPATRAVGCFSRSGRVGWGQSGDPRSRAPYPKWPREPGSNPATRAVGCLTRNGRASWGQTWRPALWVAFPEMAARVGVKPGDPRCGLLFPRWPRELGSNLATRVVGCFSRDGRASWGQTWRPALWVAFPEMAARVGSVAFGCLTAWCCFSEPACLGFPSCRRCSPNRAGRAGSSRAAQTATRQPYRNGPDFTPSVRCDSRRGADTTGSPNRPPAAKRADKQGTDRTKGPRPHLPAGPPRPLPGARPPPEEPPEARPLAKGLIFTPRSPVPAPPTPPTSRPRAPAFLRFDRFARMTVARGRCPAGL